MNYIDTEIIEKLDTDNVAKFVELLRAQQPFSQTHASYIIHQLFKWPYNHVTQKYDILSHVNCAKYMLDIFTFTNEQYTSIVLHSMNTYMVSDKPDVEYQMKVINIMQTCIEAITSHSRLHSLIPRYFNGIQTKYRNIDHCTADIVIMYCIELVDTNVSTNYRRYPYVFTAMMSIIKPSLITDMIISFVKDSRQCRGPYSEHTAINLITPECIRWIDNTALNRAIFDNITKPLVYPIVQKLALCGYNIIELSLQMKYMPSYGRIQKTKVCRLLENFD